MKKNIAIVLLVIAVLGMGGFIVYDKVLKKDDVKENDKKNVVEEKNIYDDLEQIALTEKFKTFTELGIDITENFKKDYQITLDGVQKKLTIDNKFEYDQMIDNKKHGNVSIIIYLNDKKVFESKYENFYLSYGSTNEIDGIALYNNKYLVIMQPGKIGEYYKRDAILKFINENGIDSSLRTYGYEENDKVLDGENIYYYADEDGNYVYADHYYEQTFECKKIYKWKKTYGGEAVKVSEYSTTDLCNEVSSYE